MQRGLRDEGGARVAPPTPATRRLFYRAGPRRGGRKKSDKTMERNLNYAPRKMAIDRMQSDAYPAEQKERRRRLCRCRRPPPFCAPPPPFVPLLFCRSAFPLNLVPFPCETTSRRAPCATFPHATSFCRYPVRSRSHVYSMQSVKGAPGY